MWIKDIRDYILYEDKDILVCHKPAGLAVQNARVGSMDMESLLKNYIAQKVPGKMPYLGIIHRLDQPVEGVLVFALNPKAAADLSRQMTAGKIKKTYLAVTEGTVKVKSAKLVDWLKKDGRTNSSAVVEGGTSGAKKAILSYEVLETWKNKEDAQKLADLMIKIGKLAGREVVCVLTKMDEPLGYSIGNNLEVIEAIKFLKGYMPKDLKDVVFELGANMIKLAGLGENLEENKLKIQENIANGKGYEKFLQMVQNQGGDISYINNIDKFEKSKYIIPVTSLKSGVISEVNAEDIGKVACLLGAGRIRKEDNIDHTAGIVLNKKVGDYVKENEVLAYIHTNNNAVINEATEKIQNICKI